MSRHPGLNPLPFETIVTGKDDNSLLFKESYCYPRGVDNQGILVPYILKDLEYQNSMRSYPGT